LQTDWVQLEAAIQAAYEARRKRHPNDKPLGWRLLYSPRRVLSSAHVAFLGFNPGGAIVDPRHGVFSSERGSAYRKNVEDWGPASKLQDQVMEVFRRLGVIPEDVLAGNLVPFRSPSEADLRDAPAAIAFGRSVWADILAAAQPKTVVSMGGAANRAIADLLRVNTRKTYSIGWGDYTASRGIFSGGTWIGLPHLSRFAIMNRPQSQAALEALFGNTFI